MISVLTDEDFNGKIIRALLRRFPDLDLMTVRGADLPGGDDKTVVARAAAEQRVLFTHDVNTMLDAALDCLRTGQPMSGVVAVPQQLGIRAAVSDLTIIVSCAEPRDLDGQIWYLPL